MALCVILCPGKAGRYVGGNPVCVRSTPEWQKGISAFMRKLSDKEAEVDVENQAGVEVTDDVAAADNGERSSRLLAAVIVTLRAKSVLIATYRAP